MEELLSVLITISAIAAVGIAPLTSSLSKNRSDRNRFLETLRKGITVKKDTEKDETMTYSDLQHIAEDCNQNRQSILSGLRDMLSKATAGDAELSKSKEKIRELLNIHQKKEPFAELPENISLQLAEIQDKPNNNKIDQLAASLSTLYISHQRSISKEKTIARAGFVVGILGVVWSIGSYFIAK